MPSPRHASEEELRAAALPAIHARAADVLDDVLGAGAGVAGDVEGAGTAGGMLRGAEGHAAPPAARM